MIKTVEKQIGYCNLCELELNYGDYKGFDLALNDSYIRHEGVKPLYVLVPHSGTPLNAPIHVCNECRRRIANGLEFG